MKGNLKGCLKTCMAVKDHPKCASVALLIARLFVGYAFIMHGMGKIQNPFEWMGPNAPVPGLLQGLAALAEFGGGVALILGLLYPLATLGITITMAVASSMHLFVMGDSPINMTGGSSAEPALSYLVMMIVFMAMGPGKFAADKFIFGER